MSNQNKENRIQRSYRFTQQTLDKVKSVKIQRQTDATEAIEYMIDQYFLNQSKQYEVLMILMEKLLDKKLDEKLAPIQEDTKRTRITANIVDRAAQMQLEFWNHYFIANEFKMFATTEVLKADELNQAESIVQNRIAHNRQKKIDWENKRLKKNVSEEILEEN